MSNRAKLFIPALFFVGMLGLLLFGLHRDPNQVPSALVNRPMPVFSRPDLFDPQTMITNAELQGGIFLVNVWATWCPPCHVEHPYLLEISERVPEVTFVGVNYKDDSKAAREFLDDRGNPFRYNIADIDGRMGIELGVAGAPETFLVDSTGTIRYRYVGVINNEVWADVFEPLLEQIK